MITKHLICLAAVAACSSQLGAGTITVTAAGYQIGASSGSNGATCVQGPGICAIGGAIGKILVSGQPVLTAEAVGNSDAITNLNYYFVYTNPGDTAGVLIPLDIAYTLETTEEDAPGDNTQGSATVIVNTGIDEVGTQVGGFGKPASSTGILHINTLSGSSHINSISLFASAGGNQGFATAMADPIISIDPSFDNSAGFGITLSEGIGNTADSAAPEPVSFVLVGLALGVAGLFRRNRSGVKTL